MKYPCARRPGRRMVPAALLAALLGPDAPAAFAKTKIATIGASTTRGSGAPAGQSYPDQLQALLGTDYQVGNFGKDGAGALKQGNPTYWNSAEMKAASDFAPDIVVDWLGGADSKAASWDGHKAEFLGDYKAMIEHFKNLPSHPRIICMMSIALHDDAGVRKTVLEAEVNPLQRRGAEETGSRFIDLKALVDGHPEYFADGVHLKANGYAVVARAVEAQVRALAAEADAGAGADAAGGGDAGSAGGPPEVADAGVSPPGPDAASTATEDAASTGRPAPPAPGMDAGTQTPPKDAAVSQPPAPPAPKGNSGSSGPFGCALAPAAPGAASGAGSAAIALLTILLGAAVRPRRRRQAPPLTKR
jgi:hypothetical protein